MPRQEALRALYEWSLWARDNQLPDMAANWRVCLMLGGRGAGKTRAGAEWVRRLAETGQAKRISLVGATAADVRSVMVEGDSGLLSVCPPWNRPMFEPSKMRLTWKNGVTASLFSADEPARLRGPQADAAWCDELAFWRYPEAWDNLMLGLRLGDDPRCLITTTPRATKLMRALIESDSTNVLRSTTFDNTAHLAREFINDIRARYGGTRIGRQELYAELLADTDGALWTRETIEGFRAKTAPALRRIVVAVDPAASSGKGANETGIIVAGLGADGCGYVLKDASLRGSPAQWATRAAQCYQEFKADRIIAEANQGGEMVRHTIATVKANLPMTLVHATRGKLTRAEPVAALYEQGKVSHVGAFPQLEDQMCSWTPDEDSPDRMDALVWALTELMVGQKGQLTTF
jgi:phage terminase large subunit-like protein